LVRDGGGAGIAMRNSETSEKEVTIEAIGDLIRIDRGSPHDLHKFFIAIS
jgi:hypothetical protein